MIDNDYIENLCDEVICLFEDLLDNQDIESYDRLMSHLNHMRQTADNLVTEE